MRQSTTRKAITELSTLIEHWLETIEYNGELPCLPPDIADMMAQQAVGVLTILALGEQALSDEGLLKED